MSKSESGESKSTKSVNNKRPRGVRGGSKHKKSAGQGASGGVGKGKGGEKKKQGQGGPSWKHSQGKFNSKGRMIYKARPKANSQHQENSSASAEGKSREISKNWARVKEMMKSGAKFEKQLTSDDGPSNAIPSGQPKIVALDCEMVGVGGRGMERSSLARAAVVAWNGDTLLDEYVRQTERVTNYRTFVSGIRPKDLVDAPLFFDVQKRVAAIIKDCIIVGHDIKHDLSALQLTHPPHLIRDTAKYRPLQRNGLSRSLKSLAEDVLGVNVQSGEHSPVEDSRTTLMVYKRFAAQWEKEVKARTEMAKKRKKIPQHVKEKRQKEEELRQQQV